MRIWLAIAALAAGCVQKTELLPSVQKDGAPRADMAAAEDLATTDGPGLAADGDLLDMATPADLRSTDGEDPRDLLILDSGSGIDRPPDLSSTCRAQGDPIRLGGECTGVLAARLGRYGLCSCLPILLTRRVSSESFDSTSGGQSSYQGASLGGNSGFEVSGGGEIGGALVVAGATGIRAAGTLSVAQTLRSGGPLTSLWSVQAVRDAYVVGDVQGSVAVFGTLFVSPGSNVGALVHAKHLSRGVVTVPAPCDCSKRIDPLGEVAARARLNDNGRLAFDPKTLGQMVGDRTFDLPCGSFLVPGLAGTDSLTLRVHGRAALFVEKDVKVAKSLRVQLDAGAELDIVVAGDLTVGDGEFGSTAAPARVRLWLASPTVKVGHGRIAAFLHAPQAIVSGTSIAVSGAAVVQGLSTAGEVNIHYDRAILLGGRTCGVPDQQAIE